MKTREFPDDPNELTQLSWPGMVPPSRTLPAQKGRMTPTSTPVRVPKIHKKSKPVPKARRTKARKRREHAILKDRLIAAQAEVANAIVHLKFHEIQLARFERRPDYSDLVEAHKDAKDTYERLFRRMVYSNKPKAKS